jgi:hypothetical protein
MSQFSKLEMAKQTMNDHFTTTLSVHEKAQKSKQARKRLGASCLTQELNLRGIKTSTDVAEQYIDNLFENLIQNEAEFLD